MPTKGEPSPDLLVDTSVADHEHHEATFEALGERRMGLAGHPAFETFSVLTRRPPPARRTPATVARLLHATFPHTRFLSAQATASLLGRLASGDIAGGAIYDALVGAAAAEHRVTLATRDRRAMDTYRSLDVAIELVA